MDVLEADLNLASITDFDWDTIRNRASEIREYVINPPVQKSAKPVKRKPTKGEKQKKGAKQSPLDTLFDRYPTEEDPLNKRAIAYLIRNNLEISEQEAEQLDCSGTGSVCQMLYTDQVGSVNPPTLPSGFDPYLQPHVKRAP